MSDSFLVFVPEGRTAVIEIYEGDGEPTQYAWSPDSEPQTLAEWRLLASDMGRGSRPGEYDPDTELHEAFKALTEGRWDDARAGLATALAELETFTPMTVRVTSIKGEV